MNEGRRFVDVFGITQEAYYVVELKNLPLTLFTMASKDCALQVTSDLRNLKFMSYYPPGEEKTDSGNYKRGLTRKIYTVKDVLDAGARQVERYADAIVQGAIEHGQFFGVPTDGENDGWIKSYTFAGATAIPVVRYVVVVCGGQRVAIQRQETKKETTWRYEGDSKAKTWQSFRRRYK